MKILVFGVIYKEVGKYLGDYFNSLDGQTYTDYDILIIEDGMHLPKHFNRKNLITTESNAGSTHADIRHAGIEFAVANKYDIIIFTDCDDFFSENRIEQSIHSLKSADFCVGKLIPINESGIRIEGIVINVIPNQISTKKLFCTNFFGLSNTAITINSLPGNFYIPTDIVAVDWWIYTILLLHKKKYIYDENVDIFYRQHHNNTVGLTTYLDKERLFKGIDVKIIHYKYLLEYCENIGFVEWTSLLNKNKLEMIELKIQLEKENFIQKYISVINKNVDKIKTGWWSEILPLNEWSKYE